MSPKQNRDVPPLRYDMVRRLKQDFPNLTIVLNGGVTSLAQARQHLTRLDGVMIGREAYHNPYMLADADGCIFGDQRTAPSRRDIVEAYLPYVAEDLERGARLAPLTRHLTGIYLGQAGARAWRRAVSELATGERASAHSLLDAVPGHPANGPRAASDAAAA